MYIAARFLLGFIALTVSAFAGTIYLDTSLGNLYAGDPTTGSFSLVGNSNASVLASGSGVGAFSGFADIDFTSDGTLVRPGQQR